MSPKESTSKIMLSLRTGADQPLSAPVWIWIRNATGLRREVRGSSSEIELVLPFYDTPAGDIFAIGVESEGYHGACGLLRGLGGRVVGFKVHLIRRDAQFRFLTWANLKSTNEVITSFLKSGSNETMAASLYEEKIRSDQSAVACLLNIIDAMRSIDLGGRSPLSFFRAIEWETIERDRFFGYADPAMISWVRAAAERGEFEEEENCGTFHHGATCSWKQKEFRNTNVQLTFHEHDTRMIDGVRCVKIEPDIDLYRNLIAHGFAEVLPNSITHGKTDPITVFAMRMGLADDGELRSFEPGYVIA